jgi:hypothetical protein
MKHLAISISLLLAGCVTGQPQQVHHASPPIVHGFSPAPAVITIDEEPPITQPVALLIPWAPPPMLAEPPPVPTYSDAVWVGGYWVWNGTWTWARGHWASPPRADYYWVHPYYENRGGEVVFIRGYWSPPTAVFVPPLVGVHIGIALVAPGARPGPRAIGPSGVFIPAPPGSRPGLIIPAPAGTPPAVVINAPPVVNVGMRIQNNIDSNNTAINRGVTNNITNNITNNVTNNTTNIRNVRNITSVTIVAPATAVATGQALQSVVPLHPHSGAPMLFTNPLKAAAAPMQTPLPSTRGDSEPKQAPGTTVRAAIPPAQVDKPVQPHASMPTPSQTTTPAVYPRDAGAPSPDKPTTSPSKPLDPTQRATNSNAADRVSTITAPRPSGRSRDDTERGDRLAHAPRAQTSVAAVHQAPPKSKPGHTVATVKAPNPKKENKPNGAHGPNQDKARKDAAKEAQSR